MIQYTFCQWRIEETAVFIVSPVTLILYVSPAPIVTEEMHDAFFFLILSK